MAYFYREKGNLFCEDPAYDRGFDRVEVGHYEAKDNGTILGWFSFTTFWLFFRAFHHFIYKHVCHFSLTCIKISKSNQNL